MLDIGTAARAVEVIADRLTDQGFDVTSPAWDHDSYLTVTNAPGALCGLTLTDDGDASWEYRFCDGRAADPAQVIAVVLDLLLADDTANPDVSVVRPQGVTIQDSAGRALAEQGMRVRTKVGGLEDGFGDSYTEIEVDNPARPDRGTVRVNDDGALWWDCQVSELAARCQGIELPEIVGSIVRALTKAAKR
jgi:hypothetical protein